MGKSWDVIVVDSGPGGAAVARGAALSGARVLLLESGLGGIPVTQGSMLGSMPMLRRTRFHPLGGLRSLVRGSGLGGTSNLYFASAWAPPLDLFARYGVELAPFLEFARQLLPHQPLPDQALGPVARKAMEGALALGLPWRKFPKMIQAFEAKPLYANKWHAGSFVADAAQAGCHVIQGAHVTRVIHHEGAVEKLSFRVGRHVQDVVCKNVVLAAGGLGSPTILRASGLSEVGDGFFCDPIIPVFGILPGFDVADEYAMAAGMHEEDAGYMVSDMALPPSLFAAFSALSGRIHRAFSHRRCVSLMVKARDDIGGRLTDSGGPRKSFSQDDQHKLALGTHIARRILVEVGAKHIYEGPITSAHPGGTVRLGRHLDADLQTRIKGLYVCDCSVIPEAWGLPPTLTLVTLGMRLAHHLQARMPIRAAVSV